MVNSLSVATFFHCLLPIEKPQKMCLVNHEQNFHTFLCSTVAMLWRYCFFLNDAVLKLFIVLEKYDFTHEI